MADTPKTEPVTLTVRTQSTRDTDGATHAIRSSNGDMLVAWPDSGIARYKQGTIAPCPISAKQFDDLLRELDPKHAPLKWSKVDGSQQATTTMAPGKIEEVCKAPKR